MLEQLERGEGKERGMDMMLGTRTKFSNKLKDYIKMSKWLKDELKSEWMNV